MHDFERLSNLRPSLDGKRISFTLECQGGDSEDISCAIAEIPDMISFLVNSAVIASEQSGLVTQAPRPGPLGEVEAMPALGMGFAAGRSAEETFVLLHTAAFHLYFSVPSSGLARMAPELAQMASTLSAGTSAQ
jgi:hypothetical protein